MINNTESGYVFPNIPRAWQREERFFALELRNLFDVLFTRTRGLTGDFDKLTYEMLSKKPSINGTTLVGNKTTGDIGIVAATTTKSGLMTPSQFDKLSGIESDATYSKPFVDYLSMMARIPIPTDTENKVTKVAGYYEEETWDKGMVWDAVDKEWITAQDYEDITGEVFPPYRP